MSRERIADKETGVTLEQLGQALQASFSPDILADPRGWTPEYPAFGHCSAASQIVQDLFGGEIQGFWFHDLAKKWKGTVRDSHFLNVLQNELRVDFARFQFPPDFPYDDVMSPEKGVIVVREKVFGNAGSAGQYARLKIAVTRYLLDNHGIKIGL